MSDNDFEPYEVDLNQLFGYPEFPDELPHITITQAVDNCLSDYGLTLEELVTSAQGLDAINEGLTHDEQYEARGIRFVDFGDAVLYIYDGGMAGFSRVYWTDDSWGIAVRRVSQ